MCSALCFHISFKAITLIYFPFFILILFSDPFCILFFPIASHREDISSKIALFFPISLSSLRMICFHTIMVFKSTSKKIFGIHCVWHSPRTAFDYCKAENDTFWSFYMVIIDFEWKLCENFCNIHCISVVSKQLTQGFHYHLSNFLKICTIGHTATSTNSKNAKGLHFLKFSETEAKWYEEELQFLPNCLGYLMLHW